MKSEPVCVVRGIRAVPETAGQALRVPVFVSACVACDMGG